LPEFGPRQLLEFSKRQNVGSSCHGNFYLTTPAMGLLAEA
jgi:hypothetical protein